MNKFEQERMVVWQLAMCRVLGTDFKEFIPQNIFSLIVLAFMSALF